MRLTAGNILAPRTLNRDGDALQSPEDGGLTRFEAPQCKNIRFFKDRAERRPGYRLFANGEGGLPFAVDSTGQRVMLIEEYYDGSEIQHLICATTDNVYEYDSTNDVWQILTQGTVLDDGEDKSNWTAQNSTTLADESTDIKRGAKALKMTADGAFSQPGLLAYKDTANLDLSTAGHTGLHLWVKSEVALADNELKLILSLQNDASDWNDGATKVSVGALTAGTWTRVNITYTAIDNVESIAFACYTDDIQGKYIIVDDIRSVKHFTGDADNLFDYEIMEDSSNNRIFILTNGKDPVQKWDGVNDTTFSDLDMSGASITGAKAVVKFKEFLFALAPKISGAFKLRDVYWSDQTDPETWSGGDSGSNLIAAKEGFDILTAAEQLGTALVVTKESSVLLVRWLGSDLLFDFSQSVAGVGCIAMKTLLRVDSHVMFLDWDNWFDYDGIDIKSFAEPVREYLINRLHSQYVKRSFARHFPEANEVWLFVPNSESTGAPNEFFIYNYVNKSFSYGQFDDEMTASGYYRKESATETWDESVGTWDEAVGKWDDRFILQYAPQQILGDKDGYTYIYDYRTGEDNGTAIRCELLTRNEYFKDIRHKDRILQWKIMAYGDNKMLVSHSNNNGKTWSAETEIEFTSTNFKVYNYFCNCTSEFTMLRIRNPITGEFLSVQWAQAYALEREMKE